MEIVGTRLRQHVLRLLSPFALALPLACSAAAQQPEISVGLVRYFANSASVRLHCKSGLLIRSQAPESDRVFFDRGPVTLTLRSGEITVAGDLIGAVSLEPPVQASPADGRSLLQLEDAAGKRRSYRGVITAQPEKDRLRVINRVGLEDYLLGVLPAEMPSSYQPEALKAQAVAARTYACRAIGKHKSSGFDVCDSSHCQLYGGADAETSACSAAVRETAGVVLKSGSRLCTPMYCSDCGGRTRGADFVGGQRVSVADAPYEGAAEYCASGPNHTWTAQVPASRFSQAFFRLAKQPSAAIKAVSLSDVGNDGRPQSLLAVCGDTRMKAPVDALRIALGANVLKSPWITAIRLDGDTVVFEGRGHGHGYGLCQVGANGMASPPHNKTFAEILAHYYPGTRLEGIGDAPIVARRSPSGKPERGDVPPLTLFEP